MRSLFLRKLWGDRADDLLLLYRRHELRWTSFCGTLALNLLAVICDTGSLYFWKGIFEAATSAPWHRSELLKLAVFVAVASAAKVACQFLAQRRLQRQGADIGEKVRNLLFARLHRLGMSYTELLPRIRVQNLVLNFSQEISNALYGLNAVGCAAVLAAIYLGTLIWLSPEMTVILTGAALPLFWLLSDSGRRLSALSYRHEQTAHQAHRCLAENATGLSTILGLRTEALETQRFTKLNRRFSMELALSRESMAKSALLCESYTIAALLLVLAVGTGHWLGDRLTLSSLLLYVLILRRASQNLQAIPNAWQNLLLARSRLETVLQLSSAESPQPLIEQNLSLPKAPQEIRFRSVSFSYPDGSPALHGVDFTLRRGELTALIGPSGSGKTSVANLLTRLYQGQGRIEYDGMDQRAFSVDSIRARTLSVPQEPFFFTHSIRYNLCYGLPQTPDDEEVFEALAAVEMADTVRALRDKLEFHVHFAGTNLSVGQRQRLSLARAILREPDILILDESTSALDPLAEARIQTRLASWFRRRITLVISHRAGMCERADRFILLNQGHVEYEDGWARAASFFAPRVDGITQLP